MIIGAEIKFDRKTAYLMPGPIDSSFWIRHEKQYILWDDNPFSSIKVLAVKEKW